MRSALQINALFVVGLLLAPAIGFMLERTRWGLVLRTVGESADAARAMGYNVNAVRAIATTCGGFFAGVAGSFLSLFYPGSWNERLSSGQGLMAVALVIFAHWSPTRCLWAALLFGASSALGPGAPVGGRQLRLPALQRRPVRAHARHHGRHELREPQAARSAGRADGGAMSAARSNPRRRRATARVRTGPRRPLAQLVAEGIEQELRLARRPRRRVAHAAAGALSRAPRRERRGQEHPRQVHHGLPARRRGAHPPRRRARSRSPRRARRRPSASAWSTSTSRWSRT